MPYKVQASGDKFCVVKESTGKKMGCHATKAEAEKQMAALYANEPSLGKGAGYGEQPKKRKIMRSFKMNEISAVDKAAQVPAEAILMKRDDAEWNARNVVKNLMGCCERPRLTTETVGHTHILDDAGQGGETSYTKSEGAEYGHTHPWVRLLSGEIMIGAAEGHTHEVVEDSSVTKSNEPAGGSSGGQPNGESDMTQQNQQTAGDEAAAVQKQIKDLTTRAERAEAILKLDATSRAHFDGLKPEVQETFLAKTAEQRAAEVREAGESDKIVYKSASGQVYRMSDDPRLIELAKKSDEDRQAAKDALEKVAMADFCKRADAELGSLPGTVEVRAGILKALVGVPGAPELLKAANEAAKLAFKSNGTTGGAVETTPEAQLDALAKKYAADNKVSFEKAYTAVIETPEGGKLYQQVGAQA